ncbi:hypothetical protein MTR_2g023310 [Medicago truncatula]|uniref:Uncharacterized protein n=1 Tax=Medicago truncatula TaxID=3880 RepID=A0A072V5G2_MEDTR|nr:hypothetical protein MTR_2g023310 [Medicago truncatula]
MTTKTESIPVESAPAAVNVPVENANPTAVVHIVILISYTSKKDGHSESGEIKRNEVETVMANMGLFCSLESDELEEKYSSKEFSELFDENEPSLEEV